MHRVPCPGHHGIETVVVISLVFDVANGSISLHQGVLALDCIAVSLLRLLLDVAGVVVLYTVIESVLGISLRGSKSQGVTELVGEVVVKVREKGTKRFLEKSKV